MPKLNCPVEGYEDFVIEFPAYPDELKVKHQRMFARAAQHLMDEEGDDALIQDVRFVGSKAICSVWEEPESLRNLDLEDWPMAVFQWVLNVVYFANYDKAANPEKN